ncbi:LysM peptidoglycan-binding domain-containing protein [Streptomyces sp. MMS24-I29]|uniref:LysM peptidoglycan-binding domain-containing protein n=1 Tax=Streptomyces sp. MMS24-I29 TaxID=3351480 RepID=UPI003C7BDE78
MGNTIQRTEGTGAGEVGPLGYGRGPVIAAGLMVCGALLFAGWGMTQMLMADHAAAAVAPVEEDGTVTVPDKNGNGIPDAFEGGHAEGDSKEGEQGKPVEPGGETGRQEEPRARIYTVQWGDTLSAISGETGVPVGHLVEENRIQNPDFIYTGSSLLIPPVG